MNPCQNQLHNQACQRDGSTKRLDRDGKTLREPRDFLNCHENATGVGAWRCPEITPPRETLAFVSFSALHVLLLASQFQ